jgi:hypothetical protein
MAAWDRASRPARLPLRGDPAVAGLPLRAALEADVGGLGFPLSDPVVDALGQHALADEAAPDSSAMGRVNTFGGLSPGQLSTSVAVMQAAGTRPE